MKALFLLLALAGCSSCAGMRIHPGFHSNRDFIQFNSSVRIVAECKVGKQIGSGFTVSASHVVTARHVADCSGEWAERLWIYRVGYDEPIEMHVDKDKGPEVDAVRLVAVGKPFKVWARVSKRVVRTGERICHVGGDADLNLNWSRKCGDVGEVTDAFIFVAMKSVPGNSGSAAYDEDGNVIGILVRGRFHPMMDSVSLLEASRYWNGLVP